MNANHWTKGCAILLLAGTMMVPAVHAKELRMGLVNGPQGMRQTPQEAVRTMNGERGTRGQRLNGTFRYSSGHGLMLGPRTVNLGPSTTVYPGDLDRVPEARDLHGKTVSVFGRIRPDGSIDARLVIMNQAETYGIQLDAQKAPPGFLPSAANPLVGEIEEDQGG